MKKTSLFLTLIPILIFGGEISTSTQKSDQKTKSEKESLQKSEQLQHQQSKTIQKGKEKTQNKSVTKSLSFIQSKSLNISRTKTGNWSIQLNPIPYILMELAQLGWDRKAFFLTPKDLGVDFVEGSGDDEILDLNAKEFYENKAKINGKIDNETIKHISKLINLLYITGQLVDLTADKLKQFPTFSFLDFKKKIKEALISSFIELKKRGFKVAYIKSCNFGGNINTVSCFSNSNIFTIKVTESVPNLLINGYLYYSASNIGFTKPTLTITFATNTNEALNLLEQNTKTAALTRMIREYTQKLESEGKTKIANEIKSRFIEKALTTNINTQTNAIVNAINSGSPISVLKIFR